MSILGLVGIAIAKRMALGAAIVAAVKIDEKNKENVDKYIDEKPVSEHLMIKKDVALIGKDAYDIYDKNKGIKYRAKGKFALSKR